MLAIIVGLCLLAAICTEDMPERSRSGSFVVKTYRIEDRHFEAYEKSFPIFPTPFIYEGQKYDPIKLNSDKGIICLESEGDRHDLLLHKRSAWEFMDEENEITVHKLKTCFG